MGNRELAHDLVELWKEYREKSDSYNQLDHEFHFEDFIHWLSNYNS